MIALPDATDRIQKLRDYYLHNAPMIVGDGAVFGMDYRNCGVNRALYVIGWKEGKNCPTIRLRHAYAESYALQHIRPVIAENELIVGQQDLDWRSLYTEEEYATYAEKYYDYLPRPRGREGHMALDYPRLLERGIHGLLREIRESLVDLDIYNAKNYEKYEFYQCCTMELEGLLDLEKRYAIHARNLAESTQGKRRKELMEIADRLERVPAFPAAGFVDALQSIHFYTFNLMGLYCLGCVDDYLYPYYKNDIEKGILTPETAQEYIDCLGLLFNANCPTWASAGYQLGGMDRTNHIVENELTWLFLNSIQHIHMPDPNVGLEITSNTSRELIAFAAKIISEGNSGPALWNAETVTRNLINNGIEPEDARRFTHSTCVEVTPVGCSGISVTSPYINTMQAFLDAFYEVKGEDSFTAIKGRFQKKLQNQFDKAVLEENAWLIENCRNGLRNPFRTSCLVRNCIERGKAIEQGGALYHGLAADFIGMINVVESFNVIQQLVYQKKTLSLEQLQQAVKAGFVGFEAILALIQHKVRHFGNDEDDTNALAREIASIVCDVCHSRTCVYGTPVIPGAFSYQNHVRFGEETVASPDGRKKGSPFSDGSNPVQGYDHNGPTATLNSISAYYPDRFSGGIACNLKFNKDTKNLAKVIEAFIISLLNYQIPQVQFTVTSTEDLKNAKRFPEKYGNLLVRIGGYSDFFVKLDEALQDEIIARSES